MKVRLLFRGSNELEFGVPNDLSNAEMSARIVNEMAANGKQEPIAVYLIDRYGTINLWFPHVELQLA